ncbi:citrate synthase [Rubricoccus marinus]|uniref:Citrate synthase n=1 Tax=Rubricoccus marinus TaxID=716817 RepID=A0A259U258_9BACT|nr:citrate synthase [Rubricoccus marinus]OZC04062.1 citrate synthase [Rubricoccus marinus]
MAQTPTQTPAGSAADAKPKQAAGLAGVVALDSGISFIDGAKGELLYRGYEISDLAKNTDFEEVAYLLWNGDLPSQSELNELQSQLRAERALHPDLLDHLRHHTPENTNPMAALRTAVSMLAHYDEEADDMSREANVRKAVRLTAKMPTIVAAFDRIRKGKEPVAPSGEGSAAADFLYMLNGEKPGPSAEAIMDAALVLHAEHGLNASTFAARVIGATLSDMYSAITGAIGALKGPLHGGANIKVMEMLLDIDEKGANATDYIDDMLSRKEKVMGIGHRVYTALDPRATILRDMLEDLSDEKGDRKWMEMSDTIRQHVLDAKGLNANVDFYSASVYYLLGIETDLYTPIFALSRITGWTAHLLEQWEDNRLIRPRAGYNGPKGLTVTPLAER